MRQLLILIVLAGGAITPARAQFWGGGSTAERVTFVLCIGADCATGTNLTAPWISFRPGKITVCKAVAKTAPVGAAVLIDIQRNGTSIFGATKLTIPAGSTAVATRKTFAAAALAEDDLLTVDITQVGSTAPGKNISVVCKVD